MVWASGSGGLAGLCGRISVIGLARVYIRGVQVSVLLPVRNAAATVAAAIASVLADLEGVEAELVLVDDGSTDTSSAQLQAWKQREPRIQLVAGEGRGIARALNAGLAACRAPLIARMDADDLWVKGRL